ncbi:hypothetical protein OJ996_02620 [Luteolibacter sp. GHJ8]|uniref:EcsC family protein n=1 Tax=Luteolibacter rhizosphaerae TaxID=2989719 RepID=A0ABT3FYY5_9BACT|nr:hypothetical protein [Luteolibacter rhizosphaerae]MCW1912449.1 hypothetical protein [Luteolibacter rhizosphaerae]
MTQAIKPPEPTPAEKIANAILRFVGEVPASTQVASFTPKSKALSLANAAALKAGTTAGMLSLPPGPLAWLTILPELIGVWKIQQQMVADIAAVFGKSGELSKERMLYCLFRHTAAQAMRDLVVRVGERYLVRQASFQTLQKVASRIGVKITQTSIRKSLSRWIPVAGAIGVGGYAYADTRKVALTAIEFFSSDASLLEEDSAPSITLGDNPSPKLPPPLPPA